MERIAVIADDSLSPQARTYAEYRVFAVVARHTRSVHRVQVVLHPIEGQGSCHNVTCAVTVELESSAQLRIRATGSHAYAAINNAVDRLGTALGRRFEQRLSS